MVATFKRGYVIVVLAFILVAGTLGWTMKTELAAPLHHTSIIQTTQQSVAYKPRVECPPPPYDCG